ncbi:2987_t:CDS:1, partial [Gigaspora rosea]
IPCTATDYIRITKERGHLQEFQTDRVKVPQSIPQNPLKKQNSFGSH